MTLYYAMAAGLIAVVCILAPGLIIQVMETRRLKREVEAQRARLVALFDADLEEWARRTGYVSQVTGKPLGSSPPR